jgi:hypothetical protein
MFLLNLEKGFRPIPPGLYFEPPLLGLDARASEPEFQIRQNPRPPRPFCCTAVIKPPAVAFSRVSHNRA